MGEIVTFYSYKGGTGRTMALANVAWILASAGHRVLMVDWDLEAPGLHRYFHPFLKDRELIASTGVIDIVIDFAVQATTPASTDEEHKKTWYLPLADVLRYATSIEGDFGPGQLDLLPAGQQSPAYATRVNSFNWDNFYERLGGGTFLDALRTSMLENYRYVLIDSRTGVSDTSGICTVQMPDTVVVCFTLNRQSIEGATATARSIVDARSKTQREPVRLFPVPTRVEKAETFKLEAARTASRQRFAPFLSHLADESPSKYWDEIEIAYQPYYAYEEVLASFRDPSPSVGTVLYSMERLAARLTGKQTIEWKQPASDARDRVLSGYGWLPEPPPQSAAPVEALKRPPAPPPSPAPPPAPAPAPLARTDTILVRDQKSPYWFYVSYAPVDDDKVLEQFVRDLDEEVGHRLGATEPTGFFDRREHLTGQPWEEAVVNGITRSRTAICLVSQNYLYSESCGREFALFKHLDIPILPVPWETVLGDLPSALNSIQMVDANVPTRVMSSGVRAILRIGRYRNEYHQYLAALAERVATLGELTRIPAVRQVPPFSEIPNAFRNDDDATAAVGSTAVFACLASEGWEWRPYGSQAIRELVQRAAAEERFRFSTIDVSASLPSALQRVTESGQVWIVLVESTFSDTGFVGVLLKDLEPHATGKVLVVQSPLEPRSTNVPAALDDTFRYAAAPPANSENELVATIRRELLTMRTEMVRGAATRPASTSVALPKITS